MDPALLSFREEKKKEGRGRNGRLGKTIEQNIYWEVVLGEI